MARIWLIGMMGSGKTTVAPLVAARLGIAWHDTDQEVAGRGGAPVAELLAGDEAGFRRLERAEVLRLADADAVIACGGGVVLDAATVALMRSTGMVVLLDAPLDGLVSRVGAGEGRPLLAEGVEPALAKIATARRALYQAAAHAVVDADGSPEAVAERVIEAWTTWS
ncbi:MAG: shikimate kinase [Actinomycetota bacterium]